MEFFLFLSTEMSWESHLHLLHEIALCCQLLSVSRQKCMCACVGMLVFVWLRVHLLHSATHTSMYAINDVYLYWISVLCWRSISVMQTHSETKKYKNASPLAFIMNSFIQTSTYWHFSHMHAHLCKHLCTCKHKHTAAVFFMFAYLDKHNLICKCIHTCKCTRGNSLCSDWRAQAVSPCSTQVSLKIHVQPHTQRRRSQTIYSMTHSCTCCCCHMLSVSLAHIRAEWEDRPSSLQHIHMCSRQACFHGNLRGKVLMKDFAIV